MTFLHCILAALAIGVLVRKPTAAWTAVFVAAAASLEVALGSDASGALSIVLPLVVFLTAALTLAGMVDRSGLARRAALAIARAARGSTTALLLLVGVTCAVLTSVVSLDGAVVLMVPLVLALDADFDIPPGPLLLCVVVVANASSIAVPQGNPTNLVLVGALGVSPSSYVSHMLVPGLAATVVGLGAVYGYERRALATGYRAPRAPAAGLSAAELRAACALAAAAAAAWLAPVAGIAPWWPFSAAVAVALTLERGRVVPDVPWRIALEVGGLAVLVGALGIHLELSSTMHVAGLLPIALAVGTAAALANNLPVSVGAASLLAAGPTAYAASTGLALGALATPHGSVATLMVIDLAGTRASVPGIRRLAPIAAATLLAATLLVSVGA